jgi:hypothetical protein
MKKNKSFDELIKSGMNEQEAKLKTSVFFIEATHYEKFSLWRRFHETSIGWVEDNLGFCIIVGSLGKNKPVNVSFSFATLNGKRVCFYEAISRYVDHTMVEEFIEKNYPVKWGNDRRAMTDADNFHLVIDAVTND